MKVRWKIRQPVFLLISSAFLTLVCFSFLSAEIYFSPDIPVTLGGTAFDERDVILYNGTNYSLRVDGEAMGLPKGVKISAFTYMDPDIVFAVDVPVTLDGGGCNCQDILSYDGSSFDLVYSISDLWAPPGVCIDALYYDNQYIYFSLDVAADLPGANNLQPNDLYRFNPALSSGIVAFDASAQGIAAGVNLNGVDLSDDGHMRMSFDVPTNVASLELTGRDICDYNENLSSWSLCFDGDAAGLPKGMNVEAITVGICEGGECSCEGNFNDDQDVDGSDAAIFKTDFGRSSFNRPCQAIDPCNGDFTCDGDVDGSDAAIFKADFGRSPFSNPCPPCSRDPWCDYGPVEVHEVWVDDDWAGTTPGTVVNGHVFGINAFATIQDGIDGVTPTGMVYVAPGYYVENITMRSGVGIDGSGPELTTIDGNASGTVVTAYNVDSNAGLFGFTITNGWTSGSGGGLYFYNSNPDMDRCIIKYNSANTAGGMYNESSSPYMTNCIFINNFAGLVGGIYNYDNSSPEINNSLFYNNGAFVNRYCIYNYINSYPTLRNCILWDNFPGQIENGVSSLANVTYSDVQDGYAGTGNINLDPLFVNAGSEDFHLQSGSPCRDAGTTAGKAYDIEFVSRPQGSAYDMGPYEY